jgi:nanoRNase/pAp phosphatase (c-di-AMP/oligoRNAs hydrolase)
MVLRSVLVATHVALTVAFHAKEQWTSSSNTDSRHRRPTCVSRRRRTRLYITDSNLPVPFGTLIDNNNKNNAIFDTRQNYSNDLKLKAKIEGKRTKPAVTEQRPVPVPQTGFNVILTHCTADFDSLASAVGLAKLWSAEAQLFGKNNSNNIVASSSLSSLEDESHHHTIDNTHHSNSSFDSASHVPTFVVLPRGAHPAVQRFLVTHKHLFPIRSLKSLPTDLSGLNRLALVDAQRRDRLGPAEPLLHHAKRITVVDHHVDQDSDIAATDYVVDRVGSVTTLICERLQAAELELTEAEATLLALGVHADTGSLCFDSTTPRDAYALAWCLSQGASQGAIAEHGQSSLSREQQGVLTQALLNANSTVVHGVTVTTVLLSADGFINGLAAVTQDALELSSSDVFILGLVYEAQSGGGSKRRKKDAGRLLTSRLLSDTVKEPVDLEKAAISYATAWQGGEEFVRRRRLRAAFDRKDKDGSGYLDRNEIATALAASGVIASPQSVADWMESIDTDGNGKIDFEEFVVCATAAEKHAQESSINSNHKSTTLILIGRVKAGVNLKAVKLNRLLEPFGGGGHAKAASATLRLNDPSEAAHVLQDLVDELVASSLHVQPTVGDFMTSPALSLQLSMTEAQVEDLFTRYDVRALPVVDDANDVVGLVTYKEVAAVKLRLWNKEQKRLRQSGASSNSDDRPQQERKQQALTVKGWMKQHVQVVEASKTMAEVESILLENDVGCMPVVADGTKQLVGMVTRTDLLRQHRYYPSLPYHNKGFADSIAARKVSSTLVLGFVCLACSLLPPDSISNQQKCLSLLLSFAKGSKSLILTRWVKWGSLDATNDSQLDSTTSAPSGFA